MGQVSISGALQGGPTGVSEAAFPAASILVPMKLSTDPKGFQQASGVLTRVLSDANVFVELGPIGRDVPRVNFLYVKGGGDYRLRLTFDDGMGGDVVVTSDQTGFYMAEFPTTRFVKKVEIAAAITIEYFASGNST